MSVLTPIPLRTEPGRRATTYRGINTWVSKHIIVKPYEYQKRIYVDVAGIDISLRGAEYSPYRGRSRLLRVADEKSQGRLPAEAIVLISNELPPLRIRAEDSQDWEGLGAPD